VFRRERTTQKSPGSGNRRSRSVGGRQERGREGPGLNVTPRDFPRVQKLGVGWEVLSKGTSRPGVGGGGGFGNYLLSRSDFRVSRLGGRISGKKDSHEDGLKGKMWRVTPKGRGLRLTPQIPEKLWDWEEMRCLMETLLVCVYLRRTRGGKWKPLSVNYGTAAHRYSYYGRGDFRR